MIQNATTVGKEATYKEIVPQSHKESVVGVGTALQTNGVTKISRFVDPHTAKEIWVSQPMKGVEKSVTTMDGEWMNRDWAFKEMEEISIIEVVVRLVVSLEQSRVIQRQSTVPIVELAPIVAKALQVEIGNRDPVSFTVATKSGDSSVEEYPYAGETTQRSYSSDSGESSDS